MSAITNRFSQGDMGLSLTIETPERSTIIVVRFMASQNARSSPLLGPLDRQMSSTLMFFEGMQDVEAGDDEVVGCLSIVTPAR